MQCDRLECAPFAALAARLHELSPKLSWRAAASHVASTLASFPDGVTQPVLLCTAPSKGGTSKNGSAVEQLRERLHVCPKDVIELTVCGVKKTDRVLELTDGVSAHSLLHAPAGRLRYPPAGITPLPPAGTTPLPDAYAGIQALIGRRLRLVRAGLVETSIGESNPPLLLLPTPHAALILDGSRDGELLSRATSVLRGKAEAADERGFVPLIQLRVARATPCEHYGRRVLRRLLLERDGDVTGEVEAELILWDDDLALLELLPPRALLCLVDATMLTSGDAAHGGVPAQLGLDEDGERTLVCIVDESEADAARPPKRPRSESDELDSKLQPSGPPVKPPARRASSADVAGGDVADGRSSAVLGQLLDRPVFLGGGAGGECHVQLRLRDHHSSVDVLIELSGGESGGHSPSHRVISSLLPGDHLFIEEISQRPATPEALAQPIAPPALPPPPPAVEAPSLASDGFDELSDEALLALDLDSLEQQSAQQPPPQAPPPAHPTVGAVGARWSGVLGVARVHHLSGLRSWPLSPQLHEMIGWTQPQAKPASSV